MRAAGWGVLLAGLLGGYGCNANRRGAADPFVAALRTSDQVWDSRANVGLDRAESAYGSLLVTWSEDPRVLARLARVAWSRAWIEADDAAIWHGAGREYAMRCVLAAPEVAEQALRLGDRVDSTLLAPLDAARAPCLVYAAAHTVALVAARGPGAALDLHDVGPLLTRAAELDPSAEPALAAWARGRMESLLPGGDSTLARAQMREAVALAPGVAGFRDSLERAFPDVTSAWEGYAPDAAWALENDAVTSRR